MIFSREQTIAFLGAGNMGEAIIRGILSRGLVASDRIAATDTSNARRDLIAATHGVRALASNVDAVRGAEIVVFAVKPQVMPELLAEVAEAGTSEKLFVSICAGVTCATIERGLATGSHRFPRVVRVMPNTPAVIGEGLAALCRGVHATERDLATARTMFRAVGDTIDVEEDRMNSVTALTGSGPAYVFRLIESLIEAARIHGFDEDTATRMILQMVHGSASLAKQSDRTPQELRRAVTSPGGTTAAGMAALDKGGFHQAVLDCIDAAERRGRELAREAEAKEAPH